MTAYFAFYSTPKTDLTVKSFFLVLFSDNVLEPTLRSFGVGAIGGRGGAKQDL